MCPVSRAYRAVNCVLCIFRCCRREGEAAHISTGGHDPVGFQIARVLVKVDARVEVFVL